MYICLSTLQQESVKAHKKFACVLSDEMKKKKKWRENINLHFRGIRQSSRLVPYTVYFKILEIHESLCTFIQFAHKNNTPKASVILSSINIDTTAKFTNKSKRREDIGSNLLHCPGGGEGGGSHVFGYSVQLWRVKDFEDGWNCVSHLRH